ncbi:VanZ family protein [Paenibacillus sp. DS2015]|uniref:VanZ family protein n=1 Tax=Paenibacillus sp. DS2015 TaxID=3373917 RepID=UPI003D1CCAB3
MKKYYRWIPCILLMVLIFYLSSQTYQQQDLRPQIQKSFPGQSLIKHLGGVDFNYAGQEVSIQNIGIAGFIEFFIRKSAHFSIYFVLGISLVYALKTRGRLQSFLGAILISFLYACSDELHQSFTPNRSPMLQDVILDSIGATMGVTVVVIASLIWKRDKAT